MNFRDFLKHGVNEEPQTREEPQPVVDTPEEKPTDVPVEESEEIKED